MHHGFAIRLGTLKDTDKLPADAKRHNTNLTNNNKEMSPSRLESQPLSDNIIVGKSYTEDDYSF
ncbi:MAG: hypothetical protein K0S93_543 [Nitrososphaeraceae archaeon]|jgi:hypothetical protein|nr:hypothetical protein [Nitrososphaeraceae archaeon]